MERKRRWKKEWGRSERIRVMERDRSESIFEDRMWAGEAWGII
jgi:hypothetical protein